MSLTQIATRSSTSPQRVVPLTPNPTPSSPPNPLTGPNLSRLQPSLAAPNGPAISTPEIEAAAHSRFCWAELSSEQRQDCARKKWKKKICGLFAWDITGRLQEIYEAELRPTIDRLLTVNHSHINARFRSADAVAHQPCLLGPAEDDVTQATPFICILCKNKRKGEKAKKVVEGSERFKANAVGFGVKFDRHPVVNIAGLGSIGGRESISPDPLHSACGLKISFSSNPSVKTAQWKTATLGGVVVIHDSYFALTALHPFLTDYETNTSANADEGGGCYTREDDDESGYATSEDQSGEVGRDEVSDGEESSSVTSSQPIDIDSNENGTGQSTETQETDLLLLQSLPTFWVYQDRFPASSGSGNPSLLGCLKPNTPRSRSLPPPKLISPGLDCALIPISDPKFMQRNELSLPNGDKVCVDQVNPNSHKPPDDVIVAAGVSGVSETSISGTISSLQLPWVEATMNVLRIDSSLQQGDSGAWVVDNRGKLYGMVVATVPSLEISYLVRAEDLFGSILESVKDIVQINLILPKTVSVDSDLSIPSESLAPSVFDLEAPSVIDSMDSEVLSILALDTPSFFDANASDPFSSVHSVTLSGSGHDIPFNRPRVICPGPGCWASFIHKADLGRHIRTVHSTRLLDCPHPQCERKRDKGFARKDHLMEHRRKVHFDVAPGAWRTLDFGIREVRTIENSDFPFQKGELAQRKPGPDIALPTGPSMLLEPSMLRFVQIEDYQALKSFLKDYKVFKDQDPGSLLRQAVSSCAHGHREFARKCTEKFAMLNVNMNLHGDELNTLGLIYMLMDLEEPHEQTHTLLESKSSEYWDVVQNSASKIIVPQSRWAPSAQESQINTEQLTECDPHPSKRRKIQSRIEPLAGLTIAKSRQENTGSHNVKYKRQQSSFFSLGKLFAIPWSEDGESYGQLELVEYLNGEEIYSWIRRMVVISSLQGCSLCVPVTSYSRVEYSEHHTDKELNRHTAVLYIDGCDLMNEASQIYAAKRPIATHPASGERLEPIALVDFSQICVVEHIAKVKEIGVVEEASMNDLRANIDSAPLSIAADIASSRDGTSNEAIRYLKPHITATSAQTGI